MNKKTFISSVIIGAASIVIATTPALAKSQMEKCYGVVKAVLTLALDLPRLTVTKMNGFTFLKVLAKESWVGK
jgi:hypothetical protein